MEPPLPGPGSDESLSPAVWGIRRVFCCHRAVLSGTHRPNSLSAVSECIEAGAPRVEIDVRFLADDSLLVIHDRVLTGAGGVPQPIDAFNRLSVLAWQGSDRPCFLEDVVERLQSSETLLQLDLKLMRPLTPSRSARLAEVLAPLGEKVIIGSQAHWNLRALAAQGLPVAFDPTLQWHYFPGRMGEGLSPSRVGVHGLWDDATIAHIPSIAALDYVEARVVDLLGLAPGAQEWMVDTRTLLHIASLGVRLGDMLADHGIALAAWTLIDEGQEASTAMLHSLFELGATTVITDHPRALARYARSLEVTGRLQASAAG